MSSSAALCQQSILCKGPPTQVVIAYTICIISSYAMYHMVADREFSAVLTISGMFQCLAFMLLAVQSLSGSAAGISAQSLKLETVSLVFRMSSTVWLDGYLPMDKSGDWLYQAVDLCSLVIVLWLLHRLLVVQKSTYQEVDDSLPIAPIVLGSLVLAIMLHADMDDRPLFDTFWMASLFMGVAAVIPQLWMITRSSGCAAALTSHYIATMAISRLLSGAFMWQAREDITSEPLVNGINHGPWVILGLHVVHLFLLGDFAYYYTKALTKQGFQGPMELNTSVDV